MSIRLLTYIVAFTLGTFCVIAQENDVYKKFLKITSVAIHKAQKEMMVAKKADANGLLAKAVILQSNALRLYKEKKSSEGVCASNVARKYAGEIIKSIKGNIEAYYLIHEDEKSLVGNCGDEIELYNSSKKSMNNLSESDTYYMEMTSLNNTNIDF